jgi:hypothetical protein
MNTASVKSETVEKESQCKEWNPKDEMIVTVNIV